MKQLEEGIFSKKKKESLDDKLRARHKAMSDSELKDHINDLQQRLPRARQSGSLVSGAVHDTLQSAKSERERRASIKHGIRVDEEAPANAVGGGNIASTGVGPDGEPGVGRTALERHKKRNKKNAPSPVMGEVQKRASFKQFMKGIR